MRITSVGLKAAIVAALLAGVTAYGEAPKAADVAVKETQIMKDEVAIPSQGNKTLTFTAEATPAGQVTTISFKARVPAPTASGYYNNALSVELNGQRIPAESYIAHPKTTAMVDGRNMTFFSDDNLLTLAWAPDYTSMDLSDTYAVKDVKTCELEAKPGALLKVGENKLVFTNLTQETNGKLHDVMLADVKLCVKPAK